MEQFNYIRTQAESLGYKYTIRIDRDIEEPELFHEELATIRSATENDVIHILINSGGGQLDTTKAFLSAIGQTKAHVVTEIEGQACSAATLIFLSGDEYIVSDDATFMIHTVSYDYAAKENNIRQYVDYQAKAVVKLLNKYYKDFLTEQEIKEVIDGKDFWMDSEEILERLKIKQDVDDEQGVPLSRDKFEGLSHKQLVDLCSGEMTDEGFDKLFNEDTLEEITSKNEGHIRFYGSWVPYILIHKDGTITDEEGTFESFTQVGGADLIYFQEVAKMLGVKHAHNISEEKLARRLDEKVVEIVQELNK